MFIVLQNLFKLNTSSPCAEPDTDMYPKATLAFLLLFIYLTLGSTIKNRYIRQADSDYINCQDGLDKNFAAAYPQCANNPGLVKYLNFETWLHDLICDKKCGMPFLSQFVTQCPYEGYPEVAKYYRGHCKVNQNGRPCYSFFKDSTFDTSVVDPDAALQLCKSSIKYNMCSSKCSSQLRAISTYYGSCIEPVFNSSYFHSFDYELLPLFSYQLWTNCGVPLPTAARRGRAKIYIY